LPCLHAVTAPLRAVAAGKIRMARLDDAVKRIVRVKMAIGLLPRASGARVPPPPVGAALEELEACVGCDAHRDVARRAVRGSMVLLKNERGALPLSAALGSGLAVAGEGADDLGMQCGGWTLSWMGVRGKGFTRGTTVWQAVHARCPSATLLADGAYWNARLGSWTGGLTAPSQLARASTVLVVVGEHPYAEGGGDTRVAALAEADAALVDSLADGVRKIVLLLLCGRPLVIPPRTLAKIDALVAGWLPGTEGDGVADALFGSHQLTGRLSYAWPANAEQMTLAERQDGKALFPRGHGLEYSEEALREARGIPHRLI
jgi:beta-glucosidase